MMMSKSGEKEKGEGEKHRKEEKERKEGKSKRRQKSIKIQSPMCKEQVAWNVTLKFSFLR